MFLCPKRTSPLSLELAIVVWVWYIAGRLERSIYCNETLNQFTCYNNLWFWNLRITSRRSRECEKINTIPVMLIIFTTSFVLCFMKLFYFGVGMSIISHEYVKDGKRNATNRTDREWVEGIKIIQLSGLLVR